MHRTLADIEKDEEALIKIIDEYEDRLAELQEERQKILAWHESVVLLDTIAAVIQKPALIKLKEVTTGHWERRNAPFQSPDAKRYTSAIRSRYTDEQGGKHDHYIQISIWLSEAQNKAHVAILLGDGSYMYSHNDKYGNKSLSRASTIKLDPNINTLDQCKSAILEKLQKAQERRMKELAQTQ